MVHFNSCLCEFPSDNGMLQNRTDLLDLHLDGKNWIEGRLFSETKVCLLGKMQ